MLWGVTSADLIRLRQARDLIDREYARPLDVPALARAAEVVQEPIERAKALLRFNQPRSL